MDGKEITIEFVCPRCKAIRRIGLDSGEQWHDDEIWCHSCTNTDPLFLLTAHVWPRREHGDKATETEKVTPIVMDEHDRYDILLNRLDGGDESSL
jgi:hypothetical protein